MNPSPLDPARLSLALGERLKSLPKRISKSYRFVPQLSYGRHRGPVSGKPRPAAVALLLFLEDDHWKMPFTLRPATLSDHAGQVSLPGGAIDPGEDDRTCALRELEEEIGVASNQVRVVGRLSPSYVYHSNFCVQPFVLLADRPPDFRVNPQEVAELLNVPVLHLLDTSRYRSMLIRRGKLCFEAPCIPFGRHRIWGATLKILGEFLTLARDIFQ